MRIITLSQGLLAAVSLCALVSCDSKDAAQRELMEKGVISSVLDVGSGVGKNALCQAVSQGNTEIAEKLLTAGVSPDAVLFSDKYWAPVLCVALRDGNIEIAELLIEHNAAINEADKDDNTPLMYAAFMGQEEIVKQLLEKGADVNTCNGEKWTALMAACAKSGRAGKRTESVTNFFATQTSPQSNPKTQRSIVQALINAGAKATCDNCGWTPIAIAACEGRTQMVKLLADLQIETPDERVDAIPPLTAAAWGGETKTARHLIKGGADVNKVANHTTALNEAAWNGQAEMITLLCKAGANPDLCQPLAGAAIKKHLDCVQALIVGGADVNLHNENGNTPLFHATTSESADIAKCLLDNGANPQDNNAIKMAVALCDIDTLRVILDAGADLKKYPQSESLLERAITFFDETMTNLSTKSKRTKEDKFKMVDMLIAGGVSVDTATVRAGDYMLNYALNSYIRLDTDTRLSLVRTFLKAGANVNYADKKGESVLGRFMKFHNQKKGATAQDTQTIVNFLIGAGVDPNSRDEYGETALHLALDTWLSPAERPAIVQALIDAGADVNLTNDDGETPMYSLISGIYNNPARGKEALAMVKTLLAAGAKPNMVKKGNSPLLHMLVFDTGQDPETRYEIMKALLAGGVDVNMQDSSKKTALHILLSRGKDYDEEWLLKTVELIMSAKPDLNIHDNMDYTPSDILDNPYMLNRSLANRLKRIVK